MRMLWQHNMVEQSGMCQLAKAPEWALSAMGAMMCGGSCLNVAVVVVKSMFAGSDVIANPR